jgi:hypothetical protein
VRSKTDVAMKNEVLCKFLCHNTCRLIQSQCELGIEVVFWPARADDGDDPGILPLIRPANESTETRHHRREIVAPRLCS